MSDDLEHVAHAKPVLLGLDLGTKRTGVAIAKDGLAVEYTTLHQPAQFMQAIEAICRDESVTQIIVGLPLNADRTESDQSVWVRKQAEAINAATNLPVLFEDEYLTSWEASRQLSAQGLSPDAIKARLDAKSAQLLLEQYLADQP